MCMPACCTAHANALAWLQISAAKLRAIIEQSGPVKLVIGGPPCEDLCLVNADATGVRGKKSVLFHFFFVVLDLLTVLQPEVLDVYFLAENTQMMATHNSQYIDTRFGAHAALAADHIDFNSIALGPVSRPRLYWTNLPGARAHMAKLKHAPNPGPAPKLADVLDPGRTTTALFSDCILATGQKGGPVQPQGGGEKEALNPAEVERLMARGGYTNGCGLSNKSRLEVLGESWHLPTIVELLRPLAGL